ncbi:glycosyl transferase family 2 (plasmid) [Gloeothece citriformis PCC 7424]|uniref:Glycosyl transferase family 2 n=1 Tax=Gloeothece citriformis (strain PCC 7424) TaxID=65393 RepID=B7KM25_GLOC7|nr:glycosyltransferase [Gloeothece citriformis]ACK73847.1 glycosyl transferase family 2 [Gloeothece citriformis PCC 7424]
MTLNQKLTHCVSIGITTKNRWQDLQTTLTKIAEFGLEELPILIFDDGSDQPCSFDLSVLPFKDISLKRFTESKGLITRRNQLAQAIQTKYYLSLDDDSYPVSGSLQNAVEFAESRLDLLCLSFPIYNPILGHYQNHSLQQQPYQVRFFVGCGHLLHRENFLQLKGYREELIHQGEEMEIAARAFQEGYYCYHFPNFEIHHTNSNISRNWWRMDFYGSRNQVLWNDWYVPSQLELIKQSRTFVSRVSQSFKVRRIGSIQGEMIGIRETYTYKNYRQKMSLELFKRWEGLPRS